MSENQSHQGDRKRRPRRPYGNQNRRRERPPFRQGKKEPKQTTFQKILSVLTFGLLGKPGKSKPAERSRPSSNVTVVSSSRNREERTRNTTPADPDGVTSTRLYIGNLSYDAAESDLTELFNGVGAVTNAEVIVNNRTQRSKGFAFVTMGSVDEARRAVIELHGKEFMGRSLQVNGAKPGGFQRDQDSEDQNANESQEHQMA
jgi:RNA recognition motif-containing protein